MTKTNKGQTSGPEIARTDSTKHVSVFLNPRSLQAQIARAKRALERVRRLEKSRNKRPRSTSERSTFQRVIEELEAMTRGEKIGCELVIEHGLDSKGRKISIR